MEISQLEWCRGSGEEPEWLSQALEHGFLLHFVDGNRGNTDATNLALVYRKDVEKLPVISIKRKLNKSQRAYELRTTTGMKWEEIAKEIEVSSSNAVTMAKLYARSHRLPWPITKS